MNTLKQFIIFEHGNEHDLEHDLAHKKDFSDPKIYTANDDLSKRWYVYFSFRNPKTGKMTRMKNIYGGANKFKTKEERIALLSRYQRRLLKLLKEGYNPYQKNTALFKSKMDKKSKKEVIEVKEKPKLPEKQSTQEIQNKGSKNNTEDSSLNLKEAFDFVLKLKEKTISPRTYKDYCYASSSFIKWINKKHPEIIKINQVDKKVAIEFLNSILLNSSSRNRNNLRLILSSDRF
ncbi:phage integrase N-terminal SAM-like domain-containing protein [Hwangdonia lutea]|uniref:Phage integrase N-terminal SAM-like domain-containing protein n=1 Tax=Hwangdonia lutea TaxID=3075823 RepID=A0AA97HR73_9FLAO|nr:phage integrase N-terminal SAM-like domain-containing protein [Hwangdonia sp. SCSIO 19198]WOD43755.1 phage integrase N-terminal SAM-like domain-containing protein [Hwangdonia sp. SCSIO 19198]